MDGDQTHSAESLEPPVAEPPPVHEYAFDTVHLMELKMANRLEIGAGRGELREEFLASGRSTHEVEDALVGAEERVLAKQEVERRRIWTKRAVRVFMLLVLALMVAPLLQVVLDIV